MIAYRRCYYVWYAVMRELETWMKLNYFENTSSGIGKYCHMMGMVWRHIFCIPTQAWGYVYCGLYKYYN